MSVWCYTYVVAEETQADLLNLFRTYLEFNSIIILILAFDSSIVKRIGFVNKLFHFFFC